MHPVYSKHSCVITIKQNVFPPGTRPYMPPEYYDRGFYHAKPATVFSLGVLLFVMLHGRFPQAIDLYFLSNDQSVFAVSQGEMFGKDQMIKDSMCEV